MLTQTKVTKNDILRYVYDETSRNESEVIRKAIATDNELADVFYEQTGVRNALDSSLKKPSAGVMSRIMKYARKKRTTQTPNVVGIAKAS